MTPTRQLGSTGIQVSILGLGTVKFGRNTGVKYPQGFELPSDKEARHLLDIAKDHGVNLIDTAPAYGISEQRLGELLTPGEDWVICSKVGEEFINGESQFDFSREHTINSIERSLMRLKRDVIDIVLVHSDGNDLDVINNHGALDTLAELKKQGKIRAFGMSTKTVDGGLLAAEKSDCVMVTYHPDYLDEAPVIDYCQQHNKGVLIKKALASGHMVSQPIEGKSEGENPVEYSMRFILKQPAVSSIIIGSINPKHLLSNIETARRVNAA